jgi:hypothetical protein
MPPGPREFDPVQRIGAQFSAIGVAIDVLNLDNTHYNSIKAQRSLSCRSSDPGK